MSQIESRLYALCNSNHLVTPHSRSFNPIPRRLVPPPIPCSCGLSDPDSLKSEKLTLPISASWCLSDPDFCVGKNDGE